jgi:enamine deaminase RidA (YjgF/YER057c/UK114 family)
MNRAIISTDKAPAAIGTYSQAVKVGSTVYLSGQIALDPVSMTLRDGIEAQVVQVFDNLQRGMYEAAGGSSARHCQAEHLPNRFNAFCAGE